MLPCQSGIELHTVNDDGDLGRPMIPESSKRIELISESKVLVEKYEFKNKNDLCEVFWVFDNALLNDSTHLIYVQIRVS